MKKKLLTTAFLFVVIGSNLATAKSVRGDLMDTFKKLNFNSNVSGPSAFKDQAGGYMTGGSVYARAAAKNTSFANVQLPNLNAGCTGINAYLGGFSFLSTSEFIQIGKSIIPAAAGYGLHLGMQTLTPQIYNVMMELQDMAQKINALNTNSCYAAQQFVAAVAPRTHAVSKHICASKAVSGGVFADWLSGSHNCNDEKTRADVNGRSVDGFEDVLGEEYNLVWKAIRKNAFLTGNDATTELAEFFMSLSGTIAKKKGAKAHIHKPSLAFQQNLIEMLLFGSDNAHRKAGAAEVYKCAKDDKDNCLTMTTNKFTLDKQASLAYQVETVLLSLAQKIKSGEDPTKAEMGLVNMTNIPIVRIMYIEAAFKRGGSPLSALEYKDAIAFDILLNYMESILDLVAVSLKELEKAQIDGKIIQQFKGEIRDVRSRIVEKRNGVFQRIMTTLDIIQKTQVLERSLVHNFHEYANKTR